MIITDLITITELSRLTKKSRPTIYKYINEYEKGNYDEIPYSMITLFEMAKTATKAEIVAYCNSTYGTGCVSICNAQMQELINLLVTNQEHLDIAKIKDFIMEEINNG